MAQQLTAVPSFWPCQRKKTSRKATLLSPTVITLVGPCSCIYFFAFRRANFAFFSDALTAAAIGSTSYGGVRYTTAGRNITYGMPAGTDGVNHGQSEADICCC